MDRYTPPHIAAERHYARLEAQYARMVENATCGDCANFNEVPEDLVRIPCGWCAEVYEFIEKNQPVKGYCCTFDPRRQPWS